MLRQLATATVIYLALVLQVSVAGELPAIARPWLPGIGLVACLFLTEGFVGLLWAGILGLAVDCEAVEHPGIHLIVATIVASALTIFKPASRTWNSIPFVALVFAATSFWRLIVSVIHLQLDQQSIEVKDLAMRASCEGLGTAFLATVLFAVVRSIVTGIGPRETQSMPLDNQWSMLTEK